MTFQSKDLFDAVRKVKGSALTQADVDTINAVIAGPAPLLPDPASHPKLSIGILKAAQMSEQKWGIPASVTLAQFAVESAWGTIMSGANNPFGIKDTDGKNATQVTTHEENASGGRYTTKAGFENFTTIGDAFDAHGKLLATAGAYQAARAKLPDPDAFADALTGVYATASNYGTVLKNIMRTQGLYAYNLRAA